MSQLDAERASVAPARVVAFAVIRRVLERGAYADRALPAHAAGLSVRDRALATQLVYGTVQRQATLDHVLDRLSSRSTDRLDPPVLAALRLGLFQLLYLDHVPAHAAVGESVELAKRGGGGGASLVNAVLRRAGREGQTLLAELHDRDPAAAAIAHSVPRWLAEMWFAELGAVGARELLRAVNHPAESSLRANALRCTRAQLLELLPVRAREADELPEGVVVQEAFDAHGSKLFEGGLMMPQSRASMLVSRILDPQPGERVLDLCAAPGAKTTHLAALAGDQGEIVAVERNPGRAVALGRTLDRLGVRSGRIQVADAAERHHDGVARRGGFDRVLVDPPCSGLGTLQSRPDLRWRVRPEAVDELAAAQALILEAGAQALAPGGTLVYSVCTISRTESVAVIEGLLRERPDIAADRLGEQWPAFSPGLRSPHLQLLPHRHGTDGFFIARLRRRT